MGYKLTHAAADLVVSIQDQGIRYGANVSLHENVVTCYWE